MLWRVIQLYLTQHVPVDDLTLQYYVQLTKGQTQSVTFGAFTLFGNVASTYLELSVILPEMLKREQRCAWQGAEQAWASEMQEYACVMVCRMQWLVK